MDDMERTKCQLCRPITQIHAQGRLRHLSVARHRWRFASSHAASHASAVVTGPRWKSMEKPEIRPPPSQNPWTDGYQIGRGDYVPDMYPCAKLHYDAIRKFCPLPAYAKLPIKCSLGYIVLIFGVFSNSLPPRPLHRFWRSIRQKTSFHARMCLSGSRKLNLTFWPHFRWKTQIFDRFSTGLRKFRLKTGCNMRELISKHP